MLQAFNDSAAGQVVGTALHTLGAVGLLGGLLAYVAWHAQVSRGLHNRRVRDVAMFLTYLSILANLAGGFMRTFAEGHPPLTRFGSSAWVRAIAIKHLFLFAGMAAQVVLLERVGPRHLKAMQDGRLAEAPQGGHAVGVLVAVLGILVAGVLGALSTILPVDAGSTDPADDVPALERDAFHNATGQLVGSPLAAGEAGADFAVPAGASHLDAILSWTPAQSNLALELVSPTGVAHSFTGGGGRLEARVDVATPGTWSYRITSPDAIVNAQWDLALRMPPADGTHAMHTATVTIAPRTFYEINTVAPEGGRLLWSWTATQTLHFDVHTHFDDEVQYVVEMDADGHEGSYDVQRAGGHSYLWQNDGALPVTLEYRVWGDWDLDSIVP